MSPQDPRPALHKPVTFFNQRVMPLVKAALLIVSIAAAVPTARNLYFSWMNDIPYSQVSHRLAQYDLWVKNLECKIDYKALITASGSRVDVGACQKTNDIAIKITSGQGHTAYEWIAYDQLQKPATAQTTAWLDLLGMTAQAAPGPVLQPGVKDADGVQKVQEAMSVLCQSHKGNKIIRIVQEGGKCYREVVLPFKGVAEKREEVSCDTKC